jgi:hypothetical protein
VWPFVQVSKSTICERPHSIITLWLKWVYIYHFFHYQVFLFLDKSFFPNPLYLLTIPSIKTVPCLRPFYEIFIINHSNKYNSFLTAFLGSRTRSYLFHPSRWQSRIGLCCVSFIRFFFFILPFEMFHQNFLEIGMTEERKKVKNICKNEKWKMLKYFVRNIMFLHLTALHCFAWNMILFACIASIMLKIPWNKGKGSKI